jgi:hypothetical protein
MPIVQLDFPNPLNTSVQIGDFAYFSNPIDYGTTGNPLGGDQWASTTTPHLTSDQGDIIMIGPIQTIIPWDGTVSSIICDMPQALFNQYFSQINMNQVCTTPPNTTGSNCFNKISVSYSDLISNIGSFVDPLASVYFSTGGWPIMFPNYQGPETYSYVAFGGGTSPVEDNMRKKYEMNALILHWFWNNNQSANFSDYIFEDWEGQVWILDSFLHEVYIWDGVSFLQLHTFFEPPIQPNYTPHPNGGGHLYSVHDVIDLWQAEYTAHNATALPAPYANFSTSTIFPVSTLGAVGAANASNIVYGCSFDDFWNRQNAAGTVHSYRTTGGVKTPCSSIVNPPITCTGGSFIMFSKDNKVNLSSGLGYYASATLRNDSPDKAELFNIGADIFESSK